MGTLIDVLKTCIPIIVGALIAIVPSITEKLISNKYEHKEKQQQEKQELYIELISLFSRVLKENRTERDLLLLRNKINLISITGSVEVVKALVFLLPVVRQQLLTFSIICPIIRLVLLACGIA